MSYRPYQYWEKRAPSYSQVPPAYELENLRQWMLELQPQSILEVGSGWGAIWRALDGIGLGHLTTLCDFSPTMRQCCKRETGILPVSWDGEMLPFEDGTFDLVLSFSVMLHVLPARIESVIAEHVRVSRRYLFVATLYPGTSSSRHVFGHDYPQLFESLSVVRERQFAPNRTHWLLEV